ncbi:hypothetical protein A0H81_03063 [Grifola frondosa]|uniref:AMP-dependent synthetase/ligase domain-containing protein n=1 Tax=Grifola frondosa TaxID=5627 RepID=A0A1C7MJ11_GRIFR|nr:hypothetical protein A0H81_03063 [Grifola frondosa]
MASYRTHLTVLESSASLYPDSPAFRLPQLDPTTGEVCEWATVTYSQFHHDVDHFARYWTRELSALDVSPRSVIGAWMGGVTYVDVLHIYGIARAGYVPQLFSLRMPNPDIIFELLDKSKGAALICDPSYHSTLLQTSVPAFAALDVRDATLADTPLPPLEHRSGDETVMIFHTSGSTSGRPKLVPCSYAWWDFTLAKAEAVMAPKPARAGARTSRGSVCHMGQSFMLAGALQHGSCTVQYTSPAFSSAELADMVHRCGLTRMAQFPTYLATHLRAARCDPKLRAILQGLDEILVSGLSMSDADQRFVRENGIALMDCYGSTECGAMLLSADARNPHVLRPVTGTSYAFVSTAQETQPESETGYHDTNMRLLELVILADSPDCPDRALRHADGNYHTGDLFLERERAPLRRRAIEDNVLAECSDVVGACIVVGTGRPSPALFVEPKQAIDGDSEELRKTIIRRTRRFHARRYLHERIASPDFVVVVPVGTLPRTATKGNIRRRAVEDAFKTQLDRMYGVAPGTC